MTDDELKASFRHHAAKVQMLRWFAFYENPQQALANQLDMLDDDLEVVLDDAQVKGKAAYSAYIASLPSRPDDAHHIGKMVSALGEDAIVRMEVQLGYVARQADENGRHRALELDYRVEFVASGTLLPNIRKIAITSKSESKTDGLAPTHPEQRLRALAHYWMALIENPDRSPEPFREIVADEFALHFGPEPLTEFSQLADWVRGPASAVAASAHNIEAFSWKPLAENEYELTLDLDWHGLTADGKRMAARTRHFWTVVDDPAARFPQIRKVRFEVREGGFA